MKKLELKLLPNQFSIHRLTKKSKLPTFLYKMDSFFSFTSTEEETSLIRGTSFALRFGLSNLLSFNPALISSFSFCGAFLLFGVQSMRKCQQIYLETNMGIHLIQGRFLPHAERR